jgi:hypothetical protein
MVMALRNSGLQAQMAFRKAINWSRMPRFFELLSYENSFISSGTIGKRIYEAMSPKHEIVKASRTGGDVSVDITSAAAIEDMYKAVENIDAVICAADRRLLHLMRSRRKIFTSAFAGS